MAMTREYLDIVEDSIDIAPVGSQEEVQAADFMLEAFNEHGLETEIQDLSAPLYGRLFKGIALALCVLGAVFCGLGGFGWAALGFLLALVFGAYLATDYLGMNLFNEIGPVAQSQNVIGIHRGEGARAGRGVRPIVILARYDTGREELLAKPGLASFAPLVWQVAPWCVCIVVFGTLLQLFQIIGEPALIVLWIITMVVALPLLLLAVNEILSTFMSLTDGANDNKASLAALLGVLEDVVPSDEERIKVRAAQMARARAEASKEEEDEGEDVDYEEYEEVGLEPVLGVRHGKQVLESIGMLPATCDIEYVKPKTVVTKKRRAVARPHSSVDAAVAKDEALLAEGVADELAAGAVVVEAADEAIAEEAMRAPEAWVEPEMGTGVSKRRALLFDLPDPSIDELDPLDSSDPSMQGTTSVMVEDELSEPRIEVEDVVASSLEEADAGRGLFKRLGGGKGARRGRGRRNRRHGEEELVDDGFEEGSDDNWMGGATRSSDMRERLRLAADAVRDEAAEDEALAEQAAGMTVSMPGVRGVASDVRVGEDAARAFSPAPDPFEQSLAEAERSIDAIDDDLAADLAAEQEADVTSEEEALASLDQDQEKDEEPLPDDLEVIGAPADEKLRQAVLDMGDVNLVAHDIWFVCVGASSLRHMGTQAFVKAHRRELRGCFVINLDSIGAGALTLLTNEGYGDTRRGDRKISKLFDTAAKALRVPVSMNTHDWEDTDVTPALRRSMRGITLMGTEDGKIRALANTPDDVFENINKSQVVQVSELVSEVIRRA